MSDHERNTPFHTTQWTQILSATTDPEIHTQLILRYWSPIYSFLRSQGLSRDQAIETTQNFVCDRLIQPVLFQHADPIKGKFRTFIIRALKNYMHDQYRRDNPRNKPNKISLSSINKDQLSAAEPDSDHSPEEAFDQEWARTIFKQSLQQLEDSCIKSNQQIHWQAFTLAHPEVFTQGITKRPTNDEIAQNIGARDAIHVSMLLNTIRRKYQKLLTETVSQTLDSADPTSVNSEIKLLQSLLGNSE